MKLIRIRLKNFRQFYGDQTIDIAPAGKSNVTLIHAENGVGKTTLLNAVLWCFFGDVCLTKKFEQKEKIVNFEAEADGERSATVEVTFEHEGTEYLASRTHASTSGGSAKPRFSVMRIDRNGAMSAPLPNPDAFINTVIPRAMAPYFFFDGEQAETFSSETNYKAIAEAIRNILGSTLVDAAMDDLKYVSRKFNEELGDIAGEEEIRHLERRIAELESQIATRSEQIGELDKSIDAYAAQLTEITSRLREAQEAAHFQIQRDTKTQQLVSVQSQLRETNSNVLKWIASKAICVISERLTSQSLDFIDEESLRGKIPSPYNEEFVKGLLAAEKCVCERPLSPGTEEWRAVQGLLRNAANAEVLGRVIRARARIGVLSEQREDAPQLLDAYEQKLAQLLDQQSRLEREIEEIGKKLEGLPIAEIQEREHARKDIERRLESQKTDKIRKQRDNERDEEEIGRLNRQVADLALKNVQARRLVMRRDVAIRAAELLKGVLGIHEQRAREEIQGAVNKILEATARKHYRIELDESFEVRLLFADGRHTPKSSGENQLMSLAFIAALVQFAEKRSTEGENELFIPATVAPLILDSPFGQLDDSYRTDTARFVPEMAQQVILLVSSSQGKEEVMHALDGRIGAEYALVAHNRGLRGSKKQDVLEIGGKAIPTTLFEQERNMTGIQRVI